MVRHAGCDVRYDLEDDVEDVCYGEVADKHNGDVVPAESFPERRRSLVFCQKHKPGS